ncbi:MAG: DNA ligase D [Dehalococcoidia bacterium]|jgi:bifunctional non-homologous end joining protein LigD
MMLREYEEKRDFTRSPEPIPRLPGSEGPLKFVVQKHAARRLHYDFRLEVDGVLKSWSVPSGPSADPSIKRLAVMVEDHPLDYRTFEGAIPRGQYGAGEVIVWDEGDYSPEDGGKLFFDDPETAQRLMDKGIESGKLSITLRGRRMMGSWTLVKMSGPNNNWLLIKHRDKFAGESRDLLSENTSVRSGLSIEDIRAGHLPLTGRDSYPDPSNLPGASREPFPSSLAPMLAGLATTPPAEPGWLFEPKLDGFRSLAIIQGGRAKLISRNGLDISDRYPPLIKDLNNQNYIDLVLDGEITALDDDGRPCFQCLQDYLKANREADQDTSSAPLIYYVFDILYLDGYGLWNVPLIQRKKLLARNLKDTGIVRPVAYFEGNGVEVYRASIGQGLEGIMAKRESSLYEAGRRSHNWIKIKATLSDDFVVGGFTPGYGNKTHTFGALLLGYYDREGHLVYAGHVGSGFDDQRLSDLLARMERMVSKECPFTPPPSLHTAATWIRPELVAEVKFAQWTQDGRLRQPVFLRLREDKMPRDVHRTTIISAPGDARPLKADPLSTELEKILKQLADPREDLEIAVQGHKIALTNLNKELWPGVDGRMPFTKRDLVTYLATISPFILPHLEDRPLTLSRYPGGIEGQHFYQRHWDSPKPDFVETVALATEHETNIKDYLECNNLATLLWLGQLGTIEYHSWFSRVSTAPEGRIGDTGGENIDITDYPDFIIFDLDPYIYSGKEAKGAEPEFNTAAFEGVCKVALWLKEMLDSLSLSSFIKTSGRTGLHIYVPINRQFDYRSVRTAAETIARFVLKEHPREVTVDWAVEKRTGKIFIDYNQNVRGKTLASAYSPRAAPGATVSVPLRWDELGKISPTSFDIKSVPRRLSETGDLWAKILDAKRDLKNLLKL